MADNCIAVAAGEEEGEAAEIALSVSVVNDGFSFGYHRLLVLHHPRSWIYAFETHALNFYKTPLECLDTNNT